MAAIYGVDYSWDRPDPDVLYSQGKRFAGRYLSYDTSGKNLSKAEADRLSTAGMGIVLIWEQAKYDPLSGHALGRQHATHAQSMLAGVGAPRGPVIYFAVDFDATPTQLSHVGDYLRGVAEVIGHGRTGVYGGIRTIAYCFDRHLVSYGWQTYAWSHGAWDERAQLRQYHNGATLGGGTVDLDVAATTPFGAWSRTGAFTPSFGSAPPAVQLAGPWDFTDLMGSLSGDMSSIVSTVDAYTRLVNGLRTG
jgi:Domain of unknown function (DUF1906)